MDTFVEVIGWLGATIVLFAYYSVGSRYVERKMLGFHCWNGIGALLLVVNAYIRTNYPFVFLNSVWFIVACISVSRILSSRLTK